MKTKTVAWERFLLLEQQAKQFKREIARLEKRLDRLTNHVNREVGVSQTIPLHARIAPPRR